MTPGLMSMTSVVHHLLALCNSPAGSFIPPPFVIGPVAHRGEARLDDIGAADVNFEELIKRDLRFALGLSDPDFMQCGLGCRPRYFRARSRSSARSCTWQRRCRAQREDIRKISQGPETQRPVGVMSTIEF